MTNSINVAFLTVRTGWTRCVNSDLITQPTTINTECVNVRGYVAYDVIGTFLRFTMADRSEIVYNAANIEEFTTSTEEE
mgnify:CR=1 FL=1